MVQLFKSFLYLDKDCNKISEWQKAKEGIKEELFYRYTGWHYKNDNSTGCLFE